MVRHPRLDGGISGSASDGLLGVNSSVALQIDGGDARARPQETLSATLPQSVLPRGGLMADLHAVLAMRLTVAESETHALHYRTVTLPNAASLAAGVPTCLLSAALTD